MTVQLASQGASIVLVGDFAPQTFSPAWLRQVDIIDDDELLASEAVTGPQVAQFKLDEYQFQATQNQFVIQTMQQPFIRIADVLTRLFRDVLPHTPIKQMGINLTVHFDAGSRKKRDRIGNTLVPLSPWGEWGADWNSKDPAAQGGLLNLVVQKPFPKRKGSGYQQIHVQPSVRVFSSGGGVYMLVNDHYELDVLESAACAVAILQERFDNSMLEARALIEHVDGLGAES